MARKPTDKQLFKMKNEWLGQFYEEVKPRDFYRAVVKTTKRKEELVAPLFFLWFSPLSMYATLTPLYIASMVCIHTLRLLGETPKTLYRRNSNP